MTEINIELIETELSQFTIQFVALLKEINNLVEKLRAENTSITFDYLKVKNEETALQLYENFQRYSMELMGNQLEMTRKFIQHFKNYIEQVNFFNPSILSQVENIAGIKDPRLQNRSIETLKKNIDNFYSIYQVSMNIS